MVNCGEKQGLFIEDEEVFLAHGLPSFLITFAIFLPYAFGYK